jgi:hypothetical protein
MIAVRQTRFAARRRVPPDKSVYNTSLSHGSTSRCREVAMGPVVSSRVFIAVLVALGGVVAASGCDGKTEGKGGDGHGVENVPQMTAADFYRDYSSLKGADRLNKYGDGVAITGQIIKSVYLGEDEGLQLRLGVGVDGPGYIAARFQDGGTAARKKKVKVGDTVAIRCQFNGKPDAVLFLVDCVLL